MHRRMLLLGIFLLLPVMLFADWTVDCLTISIPSEDFTDEVLTFGTADGATDLFDADFDASHPPCPPSGCCVYFPSDDPLVEMLTTDIRGNVAEGDSIVWDIYISGTFSGTFSWGSCLPAEGEFYAAVSYPGVPPASWTNMGEGTSIDFMPAQKIFVKYVAGGGTTEDTTPPMVTDMDPADGATDVSTTATISFSVVDLGAGATGVNGTTLTLTVDGIPVPSPLTYATEITGGYLFSVDAMLGEWPAGAHSILINACDNASPANCMDEFEYNFTVVDEPIPYMISGTCTIEGMSDYSGVEVSCSGLSPVTTGADGTYEFMPTAAGTYTVTASYTGYAVDPASHEVELTEDSYESTGNDFNFTEIGPGEYMLYGSVQDSEGGAIEGAVVTAGSFGSVTTGASGTYEFSAITAGEEFELTATATGYEAYSETMTLADDTEHNIVMTMTSYMVSGIFTLEGASDYTGITVDMTGDATMSTTTASDGSYSFADVMPGSYTITASMADFEDYEEDITVTDADVTVSGELAAAEEPEMGVPAHINASSGYIDFIYVTWEEPLAEGLVELGYDDGTAESLPGGYTHIGIGGNPDVEWAVQFTPPGDGYNLVSVSYNFLINGDEATVDIRIRDMVADIPDEELVGFYATVDSADDWSVYDIDYDLSDDDFVVGFRDVVMGTDTNAIYIGCDKSDTDNKSWIFWDEWGYVNDMTFDGLPETDLMIRALVRAPDGLLLELEPAPVRGGRISVRTSEQLQVGDPSFQKAVALGLNDENPFVDGDEYFARNSFTRRHEPGTKAPLYRTMDTEALTGYRVYRSTSAFSDTADAEYLGTRDVDSLYYFDTSVTELAEPFEWVHYSVVAEYDEGLSGLGTLDSGYYVDLRDTTADILIVDMSAGVDYAEVMSVNEAEWLEGLMTDFGYDVVRTEDQEGFYRAPLGYYDAVFVIYGTTDGGRIQPNSTEMEAFEAYVDAGGCLYVEGAITPLMIWGSPVGDAFEDLFAFEHAFEDSVWGHPSEEGNVLWCEPADDWYDNVGARYWNMDYEPFSNADWRCGQYEAGPGAYEVWQSQPDGEMGIPVEYSRSRAIYKDHGTPSGKTLLSSVYLGAFHDGEEENSTREYLLAAIMTTFNLPVDGIDENISLIPSAVKLGQNSPNPFNGATEIPFETYTTADVNVTVYDVEGRVVANLFEGTLDSGIHSVTWNGLDSEGQPATSGVYLYTVKVGADQMSKSMLYVR